MHSRSATDEDVLEPRAHGSPAETDGTDSRGKAASGGTDGHGGKWNQDRYTQGTVASAPDHRTASLGSACQLSRHPGDGGRLHGDPHGHRAKPACPDSGLEG